jgi:hypothetical protein
VYLFSGLEIFDSSDRRPSDDDSSRRYVGAGGGAGLQRKKKLMATARAVRERWRQGDTSVRYPPGLFPPSMPKLANVFRA